MRIINFFLFFLFLSSIVKAQDVHLTQYYTSNPSLNPAFTGNYDGDLRLTGNYRRQWGQVSSPIVTTFASVEKKILRYPDEIGIGLIAMNDELNTYNFHTNKIFLSASYQKDIHKHFFRFGVQGGMVFRSISLKGQTFPDQWSYPSGIFDPSVFNGETNLQNSYTFPNLNAGFGWWHIFGKTKVTAGYGLFNILHPRDGFTDKTKPLPFRHVFNASAIYNLNPSLSLMPHILYMNTAKTIDFIAGTNATKMLKKDIGVMLGAGYRGSNVNSDAAIGVAGLIYKRMQIAWSVDFNVSKLSKDARQKSAWEISLIYITPGRVADKVTIPCDRY